MPSEIMTNWLNSRKQAEIDSLRFRPVEHPTAKGTPLSAQRGQAEAFYLRSDDGGFWIAKKFHPNKCPDIDYLNRIESILPQGKAFRCGIERSVLNSNSLQKASGLYHSQGLAKWFNSVILMPRIDGFDWISFAERICSGAVQLSDVERIALCKNLASAVKQMEDASVAHRDLSNGNIFVDPRSCEISLIDFDSLYHPDLSMPDYATTGSEGYTAPFVDPDDAGATYCKFSDRFALAILCVEFLVLTPQSPFYHEGGIFSQEDIDKRGGASVDHAESELSANYPEVSELFEKALNANGFEDCPSPDEWIAVLKDSGCCLSLDDLPEISFELPKPVPVACVSLPEDPWNL